MKKKELKSYFVKSADELNKTLSILQIDLAKTKLTIGVGREKNLKKAKLLRRRLAQIETILRLKKMSDRPEAESAGTKDK